MGKYVCVKSFSDLQDHDHIYRPGDEYPRAGVDVSIDRLTSLSSTSNKTGQPVIEFIDDEVASSDTPLISQEQESTPAPAAEPKKRTAKNTEEKAEEKPKRRGRGSKK